MPAGAIDFPTRVGMTRLRLHPWRHRQRFPHPRGDDPGGNREIADIQAISLVTEGRTALRNTDIQAISLVTEGRTALRNMLDFTLRIGNVLLCDAHGT